MSNKYKTLKTNTIIFTIGNLGSSLISFLLIPLYTNFLSPAEYGKIDFISITITLIVPFITLNFIESIVRFGIDKNYKRKEVLSTCIISVMIISLFMLLFSLIIYILDLNIKSYFFYLILINVVAYYQIIQQSVRALDKLKIFAVADILYTLLFSLFNIIFLVKIGMGINGYFLAYILAYILASLFLIISSDFKSYISFRYFNKMYFIEFFKFSLPLIPNSISWWIINVSDRYMVKIFNGYSELGIYSVANKIPQILNSFYSIFFKAWQISSIKELDKEDTEEFYSNILNALIKFMFFICMLTILFLNLIFVLLIGKEFDYAVYYVPILLLSIVFYTFASFLGTIYTACKKSTNVLTSTLIAAVINIGINIIFIAKYGAIVACISTLLSYIVLFIYRYFDSKKFMNIRIKKNNIFIPTILSFIMILNINIYGLSNKNIILNFICIIIYLMLNLKYLKKVIINIKERNSLYG
ncbi:TPA: oligosaccharide flippase family protein [Clostridium perfringens]|nr:oligosaccharide flippase family protein [Clostridium perfringens]HAT4126729.1 oligosaccharide flippase family protein [Clostridium perfringens]